MSSDRPEELSLDTIAIHGDGDPDPSYGAVSAPIYQSSTFVFDSPEQGAARFAGREDGYIYTRMGNPTVDVLERNLALMEGGAAGLATASGMAAVTTTFLTFLSRGDHMVGTNGVYGPSRVVVERDFSRYGVEATFVDTSDLDQVEAAIRPETKLIFIETPANPTLKLTDIAGCAEIAHRHGLRLVADNTFMSPIFQRPLTLGADIVIHSMTKFIGGHTDVVAGMIVSKREEDHAKIRSVLHYFGGTIDPHQAWLVLRGLRTLPLRIRAGTRNAERLAEFLDGHPTVGRVHYRGWPDPPQYQSGRGPPDGPGALIAFELAGGYEAGKKVLSALKLMKVAVSLGGVETLIQHPASMTHAAMSADCRAAAGITDGLIRVSVGCEAYKDLEADMRQALETVRPEIAAPI